MTIVYDAKSSWDVLTKRKGSVWPQVLPLCILNVLLTVVVYYLNDRAIIDLTFDGGAGYRYIALLVSFFTVSGLARTYARFWEARGYLSTALLETNMLAGRAALYTAHDHSDKADAWRDVLKKNLIKFIDKVMFMIQDEHASAMFNVMDYKTKTMDLAKHGLSRTSLLAKSATGLMEETQAIDAAMAVDATLLTSEEHVEGGCKNVGELHGRVNNIMGAYFNLIKFQTTPIPLIMEQMGRTLTYIFIFTLPMSLLDSRKDELIEALLLIFIVTYGYLGMIHANMELSDPLGNDDNDLETERYLGIIKHDIERLLGENSQSSNGTLLSSAYQVSGGNAYGSV